jgi:hypothetical protein
MTDIKSVEQAKQLENPDARVALEESGEHELLAKYADGLNGMHGSDSLRFRFNFWEVTDFAIWHLFQCTHTETEHFGGKEYVFYWANNGQIHRDNPKARNQGENAWGKPGVVVSMMKNLPVTLYSGNKFDISCSPIVPHNPDHIPAIWCFCSSPKYNEAVRQIDQSLKVTNATLVKVPFELDYWTKVAREKYPNGLPKPYSNDPTQWIFHGHPAQSNAPLQVAIARLLGYRWPAEQDSTVELSDDARTWLKKSEALLAHADGDGIVCIPSVRGERPATESLRELLTVAFSRDWSQALEHKLITDTQSSANGLENWLRNNFFEQHCQLFHHRPFIWHIWDGRARDGFHALVNYHKLAAPHGEGRKLLESLTYSYLGDWITRQRDGIKRGEGGADDRLAAALELEKRLKAILDGDPPFDLFVRWKAIEQQPIGWEPDINDGVRLNIRPFLANDLPNGRKGAGILRWKPNINWNKDRGQESMRSQEQYPWFWKNGTFTGERLNDIHLTNADKRSARQKEKA